MPDVSPGVLFLLIVISVPLQMYLAPQSTSDIRYHIQRLTDTLFTISSRYGISLPGASLRNPSVDRSESNEIVDEKISSLAKSHFAGSSEIRDRAPEIRFRVGEVVKHKIFSLRGVICGWDIRPSAPDAWIQKAHGPNTKLSEQPHYAVLIDTRDRLNPQVAYVPQDNLMPHSGKVIHPLVKHYFERFDERKNDRYVMKPWMARTYPDD